MFYQSSLVSHNELASFWKILPPDVRHMLVVSSLGGRHLIGVFSKIVERLPTLPPPQAEKVLSAAFDMVLAAWESDPLSHQMCRLFWSCALFRSRLPTLVRGMIIGLNHFWETPIPGGNPKVKNIIDEKFPGISQEVPPYSLAWWRHVRIMTSLCGSWGWFEDVLENSRWPSNLDFLRLRLLLDAAVFQGNRDKALKLVKRLSQSGLISPAGEEWVRGLLSCSVGDSETAFSSWRRTLMSRPWHTNLILRIYDLLHKTDCDLRLLPGSVSICIYSYNKKDALQATLCSVAESKLGDARLFVLINGSTDGSCEIARHWQEKFGKDHFALIKLPVNVGAPAARNWLMHHPMVQEADWIVYLDDDAFVPRDWLLRLGAAVKRYPEGGVYGCKVVDSENPYLIQSADYHLLRQRSRPGLVGIPPFHLSTVHHEVEDFGEFDYLRPCIHVTGCCHLFPKDVLMRCGGFDLRYSPSQFDDVDHDFQLALMKKPAIYSGFLTVRHMNNTAKIHRKDLGAGRIGQANLYKLMNKFSGKPFQEMFRWEMDLLWKDFLKKLYAVQEVLR